MSNPFLFALRGGDGTLPLSVSSGAPSAPIYAQGLMLNESGAVYASTGAPSRFSGGLPLTSDGRLAVEAAPVAYYNQGLAFTANHALAVGSGAPAFYSQGLGMTAAGAISAKGRVEPLPAGPASNVLMMASAAEMRFYRMNANPWMEISPGFSLTSAAATAAAFHSATKRLALAHGVGGTGAGMQITIFDTSVWPFAALETVSFPGTSGTVGALGYSRDGSLLAAGPINGTLPGRLYNTANFADYSETPSGGSYRSIDFNGDASEMGAGMGTSPNRFALPGFEKFDFFPNQKSLPVFRVQYEPSRDIFLAWQNQGVYAWRLGPTPTLLGSRWTSVFGGDCSPDGRFLAAARGGTGPAVTVQEFDDAWDPLLSGAELSVESPGTGSTTTCAAWSGDSQFLVNASSVAPYARGHRMTPAGLVAVPDFSTFTAGGIRLALFIDGVSLPPL